MQPAGSGNGFLPSSHTGETISGVQCQSLGFAVRGQVLSFEQVWQKATQMIKLLQNMTYEESLREQNLFIPKGREGGNNIVVFNYQTRSL